MYLTILTEYEKQLGEDYEALGAGWELLNRKLILDGYDLRPYVYSPEGYMSEEEYLDMEPDEPEDIIKDTLELYKHISKNEFFPIKEVLSIITKICVIVNEYPDNAFYDGNKKGVISELNDLREILEYHINDEFKIQLFETYD